MLAVQLIISTKLSLIMCMQPQQLLAQARPHKVLHFLVLSTFQFYMYIISDEILHFRQISILVQVLTIINLCDALSKKPAHPTFYEIETTPEIGIIHGNQHIVCNYVSVKKMEVIGCLVPKLWREIYRRCGMQLFERESNVFTLLC